MRLEINGIVADYEGKIAITRQTFDANNPEIRLLDITNKIVLPKTTNNKKIFNLPDDLSLPALNVLFPAKIIDTFFLFNGFGFLTEVGNEWKFQLVDKSKSFFDDINKKLNELDFEDENIIYGATAYNTLKNISSSVWVWPIVQMHESVSETNLQYLRPHFNFWNILNKIFTSRGYSVVIDSDIIQTIGLQANSKDFFFTSYQKTLNGTTLGALTVNDFNFGVTVGASSLNVGANNKTAFRLRGWVDSIGGGLIKFNDDEIVIKDGLNYYDETTSELLDAVAITLTGSATFDNVYLYTIIKESSFDNLATFAPSGYMVKVFDNLPDLSQKDLFKDALIITNSIIVPDNLNKVINLQSLGSLNKLNVVDWSNKLIDKTDIIRNDIANLCKKNLLQYANGIGDSYFNTSIEFIEDEKTFLKFNYFGSVDKTYFAVYNNYIIDADGNNVRDKSEGLRIVSINGIYAKFEPLKWSNLVLNYYNSLFNSFLDPREIVLSFNLKKLDVINFDPLKLIYLSQFNCNFIIESINNYIDGEFTQVKILKYVR